MNNKPIIQICFTLKTGLTSETILEKMKLLKAKLDNLYGEHCYECRSCHLSRKLCIEKGFATDVPDIFDAVFGDDYVCELHSETNFADAMTRINDYRQNLAKKADKLIILNNESIGNVALELEMFTQNRVMIL